jgi:hypothetical protein
MGSKVIRNVTKIRKMSSGRLAGRVTSGTGPVEEIQPADVRTLISVYSTSEVDAIIGGIEGLTSADIDTLAEINAILTDADLASVSYVDSGLSGKQDTLISSTNIKTVNSTSLLGSGNITVGLSGTGSVDNAALRADGTGGATLQSSAWIINDNLTASPNNTVNHACLEATGATTNVSVSIKPKGTGAFMLAVPDGAATGGNVRGANAVDLQISRSAATQVASGNQSVVIGASSTASSDGNVAIGSGVNASGNGAVGIGGSITVSGATGSVGIGSSATASGQSSVAIGRVATASGVAAIAIGHINNCSSTGSVAIGYDNTVNTGPAAVAIGQTNRAYEEATLSTGTQALADRKSQRAHACGFFSSAGDAQFSRFLLRNKTTNATPTTLFSNGASSRLTIPAGKMLSFTARITGIKSDGTAVAEYLRRGVIKRIGSTTSIVGAVETIGTDIEDNALTDVAITADDTNDALQINVTGITGETWRWVAVVEGLEIAYGT